MPWMAVATIGSALLGSSAARGAAGAQADAATAQAEAQREAARISAESQERMFNKQVELQAPWREAGINALNRLRTASEYTPFGMTQFQADPGYAFRLSEGQKALENSAAARGGLLSGNTGKALIGYGQNMGSQEYQNAFNRYQAERSATLNPLQSLAGVGQTATNALSGAAGQLGQGLAGTYGNLGQGLSSAYGNLGNAQASGIVGGANAITSGLGTYLNYQQGNNLINALRRDQPAAYSPSGGVINPTYGGYQDPGYGTYGE